MTPIKPAKADQDEQRMTTAKEELRHSLGVTLGGSARKGHTITLKRDDALSDVFGTSDTKQASGFLNYCLRWLNPEESGDDTVLQRRHQTK
jgi:hypothetical protein